MANARHITVAVVLTIFVSAATAGGMHIAEVGRVQQCHRNESAAIATLKNIASAQHQCRQNGVIDVDRDKTGEYGFFAELAGAVAVRGGGHRKIVPPVLDQTFAEVEASCVEREGYLFMIFLPDAADRGLCEVATGGARGIDVDPDRAERRWCAYAWPVNRYSGQRAFFVDRIGNVLGSSNGLTPDGGELLYCGRDQRPEPTSAFLPGATGIGGEIPVNAEGDDGQHWAALS